MDEQRRTKRRVLGKYDVAPARWILERVSPEKRRVVDAAELAFEEIGPFICAGWWTATIFRGTRFKKDQFLQHSGILALDFDEGLTLA